LVVGETDLVDDSAVLGVGGAVVDLIVRADERDGCLPVPDLVGPVEVCSVHISCIQLLLLYVQ